MSFSAFRSRHPSAGFAPGRRATEGQHRETRQPRHSRVPRGTSLASRGGAQVIDELVEQVEQGEPKRQVEAIEALLLLVSPWQRGIETGKRHHGQIELFRPTRPTGRPVDHPQAARLRTVLLATLAKSLQEIERKPPANGDYTVYSQHGRLISASGAALAEVADDRASQAIRGLLEKETDPTLGGQLMRCLETIYGLPSFYQMNGICGVGLTPEVLREHQKREAAAFDKQKQELVVWLDKHDQQPLAEIKRPCCE